MINKEKYKQFCEKTYVPIYSKPWWMDAVCGEENWDVWLYVNGEEIFAAMPYYVEERNGYKYITKPPLTQNNGIIFSYPDGAKEIAKKQFEERIINEASDFIADLKIDVYEQQYHYDFNVWLPFFWHNYTAITRYTYVIENTADLQALWDDLSSKCRKLIKKGNRNALFKKGLSKEKFYQEHRKVFLKQGLESPMSEELWYRIYAACNENNAGEIVYSETKEGNVSSLIFIVWDEKSAYLLLGGSVPEYQNLDTYSALIWETIKNASERGLKYDFEGSVIKRISKAFREFGGVPKPYFRIRKVFNPDIVRKEAEDYIKRCNLE